MIQIGATIVRKIAPRTNSPHPMNMGLSLRRGRTDAVAQSLLQRPELLLDAILRFHAGEFVGERLLAPEIEGLDLALDLIQRALHLLEAGKSVGDALVIEMVPQLQAVPRRLLPRHDRFLATLGVGELALELADILILLGEA